MNAGATLTASSGNALGFGAGTKVDTLNVNGGTVITTANGDQGWAIAINLTGGTMTATGTGTRFSLGGIAGGATSSVNSFASATTSTINGLINMRENNTNDTLVFTVDDGAAAVDLNLTGVVASTGGTTTATRILAKAGLGLMQMTGASTYPGPTQINAETLQLGDGTATGTLASGSIVNNAALILNPGPTTPTIPGVISGTGTVTKIGPNAATLTGLSTYTGATAINAGTLRYRPTTATPIGLATVNVAAGATLAVGSFATGSSAVSITTLALGAGTGANLNLELVGPPTVAPLVVTGSFTTAGTSTVNVSSSPTFAVGQIPLVQYPGTIGGAGFAGLTLGPLPPRVLAALVNNTTNQTVDLNVTATDTIRWTGATNGTWDINTTQNWQTVTGGAATNYLQPGAVGDVVTFNDLAVGNFTVNVATTVSPGSVTVNNTTNAYTFGGSAIAGSASLVKSGTGTLTILNDNTYTGGTTINTGSIVVGNGGTTGALGTGAVVNNGSLTVDRSNALTIGSVISGTGTLTKNGSGTLTLTAQNTFNGGITVNAGTLALTTSGGGVGVIRGAVSVNAGATLTASSTNAFGFNTGAKVDTLNVNGGTVTSTTNGDQGWGITYNLTAATLNTSGGTNAVFAMGGGSVVNVLASANPTTFNGQIRLREGNTSDTLVFNVANGTAAVDLNMAAVVSTNNVSRILACDGGSWTILGG